MCDPGNTNLSVMILLVFERLCRVGFDFVYFDRRGTPFPDIYTNFPRRIYFIHWRWKNYVFPESWYRDAKVYGSASQNIAMLVATAMRNSCLAAPLLILRHIKAPTLFNLVLKEPASLTLCT